MNFSTFTLFQAADNKLDKISNINSGSLVSAVEQDRHEVFAVVLFEARLQEEPAKGHILLHDLYHNFAQRLDLAVAVALGQ